MRLSPQLCVPMSGIFMKKRVISEYSSFVILICIVLFYYFKLNLFAFLLSVLWYALFGMVGLAFSLSVKRKTKLSDFFLKITIPITLLPFRKAFYYWTKSVNLIFTDTESVIKAYEIAVKVDPDNLYTDNNKCMFFSFIASLLSDSGNKEKAIQYLERAKQLPHKEALDDTLKKLEEQITVKR